MALEIGLCCGTVMAAGLPELIEVAARHGFPTITVRPMSFLEALDAGLTEAALRRRLADAGVRVTQIDCLKSGLPGMPDPATIDPAMRAILPPDAIDPPGEDVVLNAAEALGAPFLNVSHFGGHAVPLAEMAEAIGGVCRRAATRGVGVALEFVPGTGLPDIGFAQRVAETCGEPNCRITLDFWHLDRSDGTAADIRALPPGALGGLQINDRRRPPPGTPYVPMSGRDLPGDGELPLAELMDAALANTPGISAEVEVFCEAFRGLPPDAVAGRIAESIAAWRATL
jgi:sugar phosphate isomerase/epimerase